MRSAVVAAVIFVATLCMSAATPAGQLCDAFYAEGRIDLGRACEADERERTSPGTCAGCGVSEDALRHLGLEVKRPVREYGAAAMRPGRGAIYDTPRLQPPDLPLEYFEPKSEWPPIGSEDRPGK